MKRFSPFILCALPLMSACTQSVPQIDTQLTCDAPIFPDYKSVTLPCNLAPVRFGLADSCSYDKALAVFSTSQDEVTVEASRNSFDISESKWHKLTSLVGKIEVRVMFQKNGKWTSYKPFEIHVSPDSVDSHIAYRLIEPGYEYWYEMGLYQRDLETFTEKSIINNRQTDGGCMNCHSFRQNNPDEMSFHLRKNFGGTYLVRHGETVKLPTGQPGMPASLVYPYWHPTGKYIAYSVNDTKQVFHTNNRNRIEVFDYKSDVVVYDVEQGKALSNSAICASGHFETFPTFSPDGRTLFFCSADSLKMPDEYDHLQYSLCATSFDPETGTIGTAVDTLYNIYNEGGSVSFPRVSPDGQRLVFTRAGYGNFSIWHRDADLYELNLNTKEVKPIDAINSDEVDSYHSWSSNGRWLIFSSRRMDGLYTRPFITHVDAEGNYTKPFPVPQADAHYYDRLMKSYNVPEFIKGEIPTGSSEMLNEIRK